MKALGKFSMLQMAKYVEIIQPFGHTDYFMLEIRLDLLRNIFLHTSRSKQYGRKMTISKINKRPKQTQKYQ